MMRSQVDSRYEEASIRRMYLSSVFSNKFFKVYGAATPLFYYG
jgi:hypothetical protein